jgi:MSHA pilin protein MshC
MKVHLCEKRRDGFTALEVIAVIFVIAVVGVTAASRIASKTYYDIAAETEILKANLRYAQFRALSDADTNYGVNNATWGISLSGSSYTLQRNGSAATTNFPGESSSTHNLPNGISVTAGTVTYNIWGIPVDAAGLPLAGNVTIVISDGTSSQTVTITRHTGFVP